MAVRQINHFVPPAARTRESHRTLHGICRRCWFIHPLFWDQQNGADSVALGVPVVPNDSAGIFYFTNMFIRPDMLYSEFARRWILFAPTLVTGSANQVMGRQLCPISMNHLVYLLVHADRGITRDNGGVQGIFTPCMLAPCSIVCLPARSDIGRTVAISVIAASLPLPEVRACVVEDTTWWHRYLPMSVSSSSCLWPPRLRNPSHEALVGENIGFACFRVCGPCTVVKEALPVAFLVVMLDSK